MFITKMSLPRRTFLRGVGRHGGAAAARRHGAGRDRQAARPTRAGFIYIPHGAAMASWTPATAGRGFEISPSLQPLAPFKDSLTVISNLSAPAASRRCTPRRPAAG